MNTLLRAVCGALMLAASAMACSQTTVHNAWVRGTVAHQTSTGAFLQITSAQGGTLVAAQSPAAGIVEIHEMHMDGNVMKMRPSSGVELPAGRMVELKPGGYHVMMMDLKQPLHDGQTVPLTLVVEGRNGQRESIEIKALVRSQPMPADKHMQVPMPRN